MSRRKPDYAKIRQLEYALGFTDEPPLTNEAGSVFNYVQVEQRAMYERHLAYNEALRRSYMAARGLANAH